MKKTLICLIIILIVGTVIAVTYISQNNIKLAKIKETNNFYETYLNKEILGVDVTTIINKATNENDRNNIEKDDNGFFIENDTNSIKIELILLGEDKTQTYQMETLQKVGLNGFIKNFNLTNFKCSKIEYHAKTNLVSKIIFEQIEE